jgi:diacylglycerol kinase family enzyme
MVALAHNALRHSPAVQPHHSPFQAVPHLHRLRRVAVVVNGRARAVGADTLRWMHAQVPPEDMFTTQAVTDLPAVCEMLLARRYDAVMFAGGDGTFVRGIGALIAAARARHASLPEVGVLRLGTGNAVAETFGAAACTPDGLALDVSRARQHSRRQELSLLDVEGQPTVFCGFGLDAMIQDDYEQLLRTLRATGVGDRLGNAGLRYFMSVTGKTIPRFLLADRPEIVAINRGAPARRLDSRGRPMGAPIPTGRVLWRGKATVMGASTVPYYGLSLRMFAHAQRRPDRFQLRLTDIGTVDVLANLRKIWKGSLDHPAVHDFLCDRVELVLAKPAPFQSGGDLVGERGQVEVALSPTRLKMI